jgi:hypothetical protein
VLWSVGELVVMWWVLWPSIVACVVTVGGWLAAPCVLGGLWVALGAWKFGCGASCYLHNFLSDLVVGLIQPDSVVGK